MMAVDTSALMAILLDEPAAEACAEALEMNQTVLISAATITEALVVADRRNVGAEMERLIDGLGFEVVDVTAAMARRVAQTYRQWGRGVHAAALNFGDCFAYQTARDHGCPLLFVGDDFARTDIASVL